MKLISQFILGVASAAFLAGGASAQVVVNIGGAQAFGDATHRAIKNKLTAGGAFTYAYTGTDINKAQKSVWNGTIAGRSVIVRTAFTGSTDGIRIVAQNLTPSPTGGEAGFLSTGYVNGGAGLSQGTAGGTQLPTSGNTNQLDVADAAAVDTFQNSVIYRTPNLVDKLVGAGAYVFVASKDAPVSVPSQVVALVTTSGSTTATVPNASTLSVSQSLVANANIAAGTYISAIVNGTTITLSSPAIAGDGVTPINTTFNAYEGLSNITQQQAQALWNVGNLPLALFSGSSADRLRLVTPTFQTPGINYPAPVQVFATGRDYGSGARVVSFIETGIGGETNVRQYRPIISSNVVTSQQLYPAVTINGISFPAGADGNTSNGNLATTVLKASTLASIGGYYISYLPTLDAANAIAQGAHLLKYNGVLYSPEAVSEGAYPLWAYEHLLYKSSLTSDQKAVLDAIAQQLRDVDATLLISALRVARPVDGGIITNDY